MHRYQLDRSSMMMGGVTVGAVLGGVHHHQQHHHHEQHRRLMMDYDVDTRTVSAVRENEHVVFGRGSRNEEEDDLACKKLKSLEANDFSEEFDDLKQLSHMSFAQKGSVCYETSVIEKSGVTLKEILRVVNKGSKPDTCTLNGMMREEQEKPARVRDERALLYFSKVKALDHEPPLLVTVEERIVGQELADVICGCGLAPGSKSRLGYMANLFIQMCHGVAFLHEHGYTHNDLAPDNIMVESGLVRIKIIDFDSVVNVNNPQNARFVDENGSVLHDWYNLQLYHKEPYRAVECWKAYELVCTDRRRRVFLDLKKADTFALLILFWEMLMNCPPPMEELSGATSLAQQFARGGEVGGEVVLAEAFEQGFDSYFSVVIDALEKYGRDIREDLESVFNDIADVSKPENIHLDDGTLGTKVHANRMSVNDVLNLDWLRRARTI